MREQVRVATELVDVVTVLLSVRQAAPDKRLWRDKRERGRGRSQIPQSEVRSKCTVMWGGVYANLGFIADHRFGRELDFSGFEDGVLL